MPQNVTLLALKEYCKNGGEHDADVSISHAVKYCLVRNQSYVLVLCKLAQKVIPVVSQNTEWNMMCFAGCKVTAEPKRAKKKTTVVLEQTRLPIQVYFKSVNIICLKKRKKNRWHSLEIVFEQRHSGVATKGKLFLLNILTEKSSKAERWWLVSSPRRRETARFTLKVQMKCIKSTHWASKQIFTIPFCLLRVSSLCQSKMKHRFCVCVRH